MTRDEFEAKVRTGQGAGQQLDEGYFTIVACGPECTYADCKGWRLVVGDHLRGLEPPA